MLWFTLNTVVIPVWVNSESTNIKSRTRIKFGYYLRRHPVKEDNGLIVWLTLADHRLINVLSLVIVFLWLILTFVEQLSVYFRFNSNCFRLYFNYNFYFSLLFAKFSLIFWQKKKKFSNKTLSLFLSQNFWLQLLPSLMRWSSHWIIVTTNWLMKC